jgi:phage baseplate assembly protein W
MAKAFSIEDGNLAGTSIIGARSVDYLDIDLAFANKPAGDIFKKAKAAAVKQSVKNLLLTNRSEKPFDMTFGGDLNDFLFELSTGDEADRIIDKIYEAVDLYEPRARVIDVSVNLRADSNNVRVTVTFEVISVGETVTLDLNLLRLR